MKIKKDIPARCVANISVDKDILKKIADEVYKHIVEDFTSHVQLKASWILLDNCSNDGYYCSNCHKKLVKIGYSDTVKKIKYCPNCGYKMEKNETRNRL